MTKVKKHLYFFCLMDMNRRLTQCTSFMDFIGMDIRVYRTVQKDKKRDTKIRVRSIVLYQIMDEIH